MNFADAIDWLTERNGWLNAYKEELKDASVRKDKAKKRDLDSHEALEFLSAVGTKSQEDLKNFIEHTVSLALRAVFEKDYKFKLEFEVKYKQPTAEFFIINPAGKEISPKDEEGGGGVSDVVAFALRAIVWSLHNPRPRAFMVLDEPFKNIDANRRPKAAELLKQFVEMFDIQLLLVTHDNYLLQAADRIYKFELDGDQKTVVSEM
jgi:hypothetical protein